MHVKLISKPETQKMIKALKKAGAPVEKSASGLYTLKDKAGKKLFGAAPGSRGYLVTYVEGLFV